MNDDKLYQLEFMSTDELCHIAQKCKREIEKLTEKMRLFGVSHELYQTWKIEKNLKQRRRNYVLRRIKSRQLRLL